MRWDIELKWVYDKNKQGKGRESNEGYEFKRKVNEDQKWGGQK